MEGKEMLYLKLFVEVCRKINESLELNKILTLVTENTTTMLGAKGCIIYLLDKLDSKLKVGSHHGLSEAYIRKGPVDADKSIIASLKGETVFLPDAINDHRVQYPDEARKEGIVSILSIPLMVRGNVIGVLRIYTAEPRSFEDIEMTFASGLADITAIAIENASMYSHLEADYQKLINDVHSWFDYGPLA
ncbi:MAG: GAF domain-containing protein [Desulfobacteraceae bacterium]|jgi:GAF domain-containing protein